MTTTLLRQVRLLDPLSGVDQVADVLMAEGVFQAIAPHLSEVSTVDETVDATGQVLVPGLVDLYSHSGEPGHESRETLASLMQGAIAGGVTRLGILPNTAPALDHLGALRDLHDRVLALPWQPQPQLLPWAALTHQVAGEQMTELGDLAGGHPLAGFADGLPLNQPVLLRRLLEYLRPLHRPVALWPCDRALAGDGAVREGALSFVMGLPASPVSAETAAIAALLEMVAELGTPVHLMRLSTARGVEQVRDAKRQGLPVTASTTWMHGCFSAQATQHYDPNLRLDPPLGNPTDQQALIEAVATGTLDAVAIDHSPYTYEEKTVAFSDAPPGAIGLELAFSVLWQRFVAPGQWSALTLVQAMSTRPAQCLGLTPAAIAVGAPVEAFLFDPEVCWTVDAATLRSRARNTPFLHQSLQGRVLRTFIADETATLNDPLQSATRW